MSVLVRAFWIFIALLHLGIFFLKIVDGGMQGAFTQVRLVLLIAASIYGGFRTWRPAEHLDQASPRRVIALLLLVFAGHCAVSSSSYAREVRESLASAEWGRIAAVAPMVLAFAAAAGLVMAQARRVASSPRVIAFPAPLFLDFLPTPRPPSSNRFVRPPPVFHS